MKIQWHIVGLITCIAAICAAPWALAFSGGAPAQHNGSTASGGAINSCLCCHSGGGAGNVQIIGAPQQYSPGNTYDLTIRINDAAPDRATAGFQLSAELANGTAAGNLILTEPTATQYAFCAVSNCPDNICDNAGNQWVTHTGQGVGDRATNWAGSAEYAVRWQAPPAGAGPVTFFAAGNAVNFLGTPDGDNVYLTSASAQEAECVTNADCDDANVCTNDVCNAGSCANTSNTVACDDGDVCTDNDVCMNGLCGGTDNPSCCTANADCNDADACTSDTCVNNTCQHQPIANCCTSNAQCNDGDDCTNDTCVANACQNQDNGTCLCTTNSDCDDGNLCTSDSCNAGTGMCSYANLTGACDDTNPCTVDDACQNGICSGFAVADCCRTNADCQTGEVCAANTCVDPAKSPCDSDAECDDDGQFCTGEELCDSNAGVCASQGTPCAANQTCDETADVCAFMRNELADADIDAFDAETGEVASFDALSAGQTVFIASPDPRDVDSRDVKRRPAGTDRAVPRQAAPGCECIWTINGQGELEEAPEATDDTCTIAYTPALDDTEIAVSVVCPPLTEEFTYAQGLIVQPACMASTDCDDHNLCTDNLCVNGACEFMPNEATCDDDDACTSEDTCADGICAGEPVDGCCETDMDCDDADICTDDTCGDDGTCSYTPSAECLPMDETPDDDDAGTDEDAAADDQSADDTDNDGVTDDQDLCPDTDDGVEADNTGCACSQRDTDTDGVNDCDDACPDSPLGQAVNADGCVPVDADLEAGDGAEQALPAGDDSSGGRSRASVSPCGVLGWIGICLPFPVMLTLSRRSARPRRSVPR